MVRSKLKPTPIKYQPVDENVALAEESLSQLEAIRKARRLLKKGVA
jgi:hypothetical protein